jgi:hypothetical protein
MKKNQRYAALGLTAGLLGGGAAGLVLGTPGFSAAAGGTTPSLVQQEDAPDDTTTDGTTTDDTTTDDTTTDDTTTDDTTTDDTTTDDTSERGGSHLRESLQALVDDGTLTSEQADAVAEHLVASRPDHGGLGGGRGHHRGPGFDGEVVAGIIGIDPEALHEQLRAGSSLAEIAEANGVDPQAVIDALVTEATEHLALAVENGRLTQAEADERLADLTERITDRVNTPHEPRD